MVDIDDCPVDDCKDCDYHRTESWCAKAIPLNKTVYDDKYRSYMEGFWEALNWAEEQYKWLEEHYEKHNDYIAMIEQVLKDCHVNNRYPTAEEIAEIDNYWNE